MCSWPHTSHDQGIAVASADTRVSRAQELGAVSWLFGRGFEAFTAHVRALRRRGRLGVAGPDGRDARVARSVFLSCHGVRARVSVAREAPPSTRAVSENSRQRRKETVSKSAPLPRAAPRGKSVQKRARSASRRRCRLRGMTCARRWPAWASLSARTPCGTSRPRVRGRGGRAGRRHRGRPRRRRARAAIAWARLKTGVSWTTPRGASATSSASSARRRRRASRLRRWRARRARGGARRAASPRHARGGHGARGWARRRNRAPVRARRRDVSEARGGRGVTRRPPRDDPRRASRGSRALDRPRARAGAPRRADAQRVQARVLQQRQAGGSRRGGRALARARQVARPALAQEPAWAQNVPLEVGAFDDKAWREDVRSLASFVDEFLAPSARARARRREHRAPPISPRPFSPRLRTPTRTRVETRTT